jgi:hypothetical protein
MRKLSYKKRQPNAHSSHVCKEWERVRPLWVLCTQSFPAFLQDANKKTSRLVMNHKSRFISV